MISSLKKHIVFKFKKAFLSFGTRKESETLFYAFLLAMKKYINKNPFFGVADGFRECEAGF